MGILAISMAEAASRPVDQPTIGSRSIPQLTVGKLRFRDLNRDGALQPFEDWRLPAERRAADLVSRMTLEEKATAMMHPVWNRDAQITEMGITSFLSRVVGEPALLAEKNNRLQELAEGRRIAIPLTISTDPRNVFTASLGTTVAAGGFSQWPDPAGFGAIGDPAIVRRFGQIAAREYRAVGLNMALSPQADIATEPRWPRISGTFGENPKLVGMLAAAYVEGFQGGSHGVTSTGVAAVIKHFAGYGAAGDNGFDSHNYYGRFAAFTGKSLETHVAAFRPSFTAKVAGVMPTYSILRGTRFPQVGAAWNAPLLQGVLRDREGYGGMVLSDWDVTRDCKGGCLVGQNAAKGQPFSFGMPWGMETMSRDERTVAAIKAGVDQLGNEENAAPIVAAVKNGRLPIASIDASVRRIMTIKFRLGLFENPYVDPARAAAIVGQPSHRAAALDAQQRSLVLLKNDRDVLPVKPEGRKVFLRGVDPSVARAAGFVIVDRPADADLAIIRTTAPFQRLHPDFIMGAVQHEGDLDFKPDNPDLIAIREAAAHVPTIVTVYLDRPAILTAVQPLASAMLGNFGVSDEALLNVITGRARPHGRLPFELPSSMSAVRAQRPDLPHDSKAPLYDIGYGLSYRR